MALFFDEKPIQWGINLSRWNVCRCPKEKAKTMTKAIIRLIPLNVLDFYLKWWRELGRAAEDKGKFREKLVEIYREKFRTGVFLGIGWEFSVDFY
jgi:hypothetical protein